MRGAGIGQILYQRFDRFDRRVDIEVDYQVGAIDAVLRSAGNAADGDPAIADGAARDADLPGAIALVTHAQLVGGIAALRIGQVDPSTAKVG